MFKNTAFAFALLLPVVLGGIENGKYRAPFDNVHVSVDPHNKKTKIFTLSRMRSSQNNPNKQHTNNEAGLIFPVRTKFILHCRNSSRRTRKVYYDSFDHLLYEGTGHIFLADISSDTPIKMGAFRCGGEVNVAEEVAIGKMLFTERKPKVNYDLFKGIGGETVQKSHKGAKLFEQAKKIKVHEDEITIMIEQGHAAVVAPELGKGKIICLQDIRRMTTKIVIYGEREGEKVMAVLTAGHNFDFSGHFDMKNKICDREHAGNMQSEIATLKGTNHMTYKEFKHLDPYDITINMTGDGEVKKYVHEPHAPYLPKKGERDWEKVEKTDSEKAQQPADQSQSKEQVIKNEKSKET